MGTMKKYIAASSFESAQLCMGADTTSVSIIPFKTITGTDINSTYYYGSNACSNAYVLTMNNMNLRNLIPVATADEINNYDVNDYLATSVATLNYTTQRIVQSDMCRLVYVITLTNNDTMDKTINCIKFTKRFVKTYASGNCTANYDNALCYGYFLDEPVTLAAGESKSLSISFEIKV